VEQIKSTTRQPIYDLRDTKNLTDEQADWLSDFYPLKGRSTQRDKEGVTLTRELKAAAHKRVAEQRGVAAPTSESDE
jgi:hypothetical protein